MQNQNFNSPQKEFPFRSLNQTLEILNCSRSYLYKLIHQNIIHPHYLERDKNGKPTGKPYFRIDEIQGAFFTVFK
jgi:hypothetical protein